MPTLRSRLIRVTILPHLCHDPASSVSRSCLIRVTILTQLCHDPDPVASNYLFNRLGHLVHGIIQNRNSISVESDCDLSGIGLRSQWNRTAISVESDYYLSAF